MIEEIKHNTLSRLSRLCWKGRQLVMLCLAAIFALSAASCADYLDVVPENSQVADDYWQTGQDVERVLMGG